MKVKIDRDTIEYIVKQLKYDEKRNPKKNGVHLSGLVIDAEPITMNETNKEPSEINWEKGLLNGECFDFELWDSENNSLSEIEEKMVEKLTDLVLPRHMTYFDWNLPFAQASIIVLRPFIKNLLSQKDTEWRQKIDKLIPENTKIGRDVKLDEYLSIIEKDDFDGMFNYGYNKAKKDILDLIIRSK